MSVDLYLDTEFNGFGGELISMAIVSADGDEWYEVCAVPENANQWVLSNVVPKIKKQPIGMKRFRESLHGFLRKFDKPTLHVDWHTDAAWFFECLSGKNHSEALVFPCRLELHSDLPEYHVYGDRHNALCDARGLMEYLK